MGCCEAHEGTPVKEIKPYSKRSCTDLLFLTAFLAFWGLTGFMVWEADHDGGDPNKIIRGMDFNGVICGEGEALDRPFAAWPYPPAFDYRVCVTDCAVTIAPPAVQATLPNAIAWQLNSTQVMYFCVPSFPSTSVDVSITFNGKMSGDFGTRSLGDIWTAGDMILLSAVVTLAVAFLYVYTVKHVAGCVVWTCILLTIVGGTAAGVVLVNEAGPMEATDSYDVNRNKALRWAGYTFLAVTGVFCVVIVFLRKQINLAIAVVQEASKVMEDVPSLLLFPVFPIAFALAYVVLWSLVAMYIYSVGELIPKTASGDVAIDHVTGQAYPNNSLDAKYLQFDETYRNYLWVHFFGLLWNVQFLVYFAYLTIAGAVADWYFSPQAERSRVLRAPVLSSCLRSARFHVGSVAFGSLFIAIIQFTRFVLNYLAEKATSEQPNALQKCTLCMVNCCLKCLECCLDKISKNAYVWMSIWGDNFCVSSCSSFSLIWRNLARVAALNMVGSYLVTLGKFTVATLTTGIFAFVFVNSEKYQAELTSPILPCLCIFILSWCLSYLFMVVFETAIDTTFLCFLVDYEHNKGGQMMASPSLQALVNEHSGKSQAEAARKYKAKDTLMGQDSGRGYNQL